MLRPPATVLYDAAMSELPSDPSTASSHDEPAAYEAWFRAKVETAVTSMGPGIPHEPVMEEARTIVARFRDKQRGEMPRAHKCLSARAPTDR